MRPRWGATGGTLSLLFALSSWGCNSDEASSEGCTTEAQCRSDQICMERRCVDIEGPPASGGAGNDADGGDGGSVGSGGSSDIPDGATLMDAPALECIGPQASNTAGQDCVCPEDCDPGETCVDELSTGAPGGYCARTCADADPCPGNLRCVELTPGDPTTAGCTIPCADSGDCPLGDICQNQEVDGPLMCVPYCQSDDDCPATGRCDPYTGVCGDFGDHPGDADIGEPCMRDSDCISDFCVPPAPAFPGGFCTAFCSLSRQGCPEGSACTANWADIGDLGLCFSTCATTQDCRAGYMCGTYPGYPDRVCAPMN